MVSNLSTCPSSALTPLLQFAFSMWLSAVYQPVYGAGANNSFTIYGMHVMLWRHSRFKWSYYRCSDHRSDQFSPEPLKCFSNSILCFIWTCRPRRSTCNVTKSFCGHLHRSVCLWHLSHRHYHRSYKSPHCNDVRHISTDPGSILQISFHFFILKLPTGKFWSGVEVWARQVDPKYEEEQTFSITCKSLCIMCSLRAKML